MSRIQTCYRGGLSRDDPRPGWWIGFRYDVDTIEALKAAIPHTDRAWVKIDQLWWIAREHEAAILRLLPEFEAFQRQAALL